MPRETGAGSTRAPTPSCFWALRGGGGNFGVVTSFEFDLHQVGPTVYGGPRAWPADRAPEVLACFRELIAGAPDELTMLAVMRLAPPAPWIPAEQHGKPVVMLVSFYSGDPEDAPALLAPLDALGAPIAEAEGPKPYVALQKLFDAGQVDGFQNYWKAEYLSALPDEAIAAMSEHGSRISSPLSDTKILQTGGAAARSGTTRRSATAPRRWCSTSTRAGRTPARPSGTCAGRTGCTRR